MENILNAALELIKHVSIIPVQAKSKQPAFTVLPKDSESGTATWKPFQTRIATEAEIKGWIEGGVNALALVCGEISSRVEILDFDNHFGDATKIYNEWREIVENTIPGTLSKIPVQTTQRGGYHCIYRCSVIAGSQKLAQRQHGREVKALIETKGEGGYALIDPSPGYHMLSGSLSDIPILTPEERSLLLDAAISLNEFDTASRGQTTDYASYDKSLLPGNQFNQRGEVLDDLERDGWEVVRRSPDGKMWLRRPGKNEAGISASYNVIPNKFYVFSTNAYPFEAGKAYDKFDVYAILNHGGDLKVAARTLSELGYGESRRTANENPMYETVTKKMTSEKPKLSDKIITKQGKLRHRQVKDNIVDIIEEFLRDRYNFRFNVIKGRVEVKKTTDPVFEPISDRVVNDIWCSMNRQKISASKDKIETVLNSQYSLDFNPLLSYFDNLPTWDGENHIANFIKLITVEPGQEKLLSLYFTKWIVGVVACATGKGINHYCLTLVGGQGVGKTTILGRLVPNCLRDYYATTQINPNDKDSKILLSEAFLVNLDELESSTREETGHLKSLMTLPEVTVRRPYARHNEVLKRRASFCGSVNRSMFLTDMTGSRRFLTVSVTHIDLISEINIDQLYAQAKLMLDNRFQYWFDAEETALINEANTLYQDTRPEEELLLSYFKPYDITDVSIADVRSMVNNNTIELLSASDILNILQNKVTKLNLNHKVLGQALRKTGFQQFHIKIRKEDSKNGTTRRVYAVKRMDEKIPIFPEEEPF